MSMPDGRIGHAEVRIDDSIIMIGDAREESNAVFNLSICNRL
jgi:uncharacterized glyoxalase superfamily protein PhnB